VRQTNLILWSQPYAVVLDHKEETPDLWRDFIVGQCIDVADSVNRWSEAEIKRVEPGRIYIRYIFWGLQWDEWIDKDSTRLAAAGSQVCKYATKCMFYAES
jgi:hypothetical protein